MTEQIEDAEFTDLAIVEKKLGIKDNSFLDLRPIISTKRPDNGKYDLHQKAEAVVLMSIYIDVNDLTLELEPDFSQVSEHIGYSVQTLRRWWKQKETILDLAKTYVKDLQDVHALKLFTITRRVEDELLEKDLSGVSFKDLANSLKTLTIVRRVVQEGDAGHAGKTVHHEHRIKFVPPGIEG